MIRGISETRFVKRINRANLLFMLTHPTPIVSHTAARQLRGYPTQNYPVPPKPVRLRRFLRLLATPTIIEVPDVLGLSQSAAQLQIASRGLTSIVIGSASTPFPINTVGLQSPVSGTIVSAGALVSLTISLGPTGSMPDFTGLSLDDATTQINLLGGILAGVVYEDATFPFPAITRGTVIGQFPLPGTFFTTNVEITLFCASGRIFYPEVVESVGNEPDMVMGSTTFP